MGAENNKIQKKDPLGGGLNGGYDPINKQEITIPDDSRDYSKDVEAGRALGLPDVQQVKVINPITKKESLVTIDRTGTTEQKLAMALLSPDINSEQKDAMLSMFLFERGKESASMLMDIYQRTGLQTKEVRAFKGQMRFDYEMFVAMITTWMSDMSDEILDALEIEESKQSIIERIIAKKGKMKDAYPKMSKTDRALLRMGIGFYEVADDIMRKTKELTEQREGEKGKGIYVSKSGRVYNITDAQKIFNEELEEARAKQEKVEEG